ncbi:MAG: DUF6515 family protein [Pirellulales bacterium]|nr:DUF6515 family protein [Pirellulales bacterium]
MRPAPKPSPAAAIARTARYLIAPPKGHVVITLGGVNYFRYGHVYYRRVVHQGRWVYVEIAPPVGIVVTQLPPSPDRVVINGQVYYRSGTTFYARSPSSAETASTETLPTHSTSGSIKYVVTRPPVGAVVSALPQGSEALQAGPTTYFKSGGSYYLPIQVGMTRQFVVVEKPN